MDRAKRLVGRLLSEEEQADAREGARTKERFGRRSEVLAEWSMIGNNPQIKTTEYVWQRTRDVSHRGVIHEGFYHDETVTAFYTPDGRLEERHTESGHNYCVVDMFGENVPKDRASYEIEVFSPPGSWKGKKVKEGKYEDQRRLDFKVTPAT